jgi:hypothetical protein
VDDAIAEAMWLRGKAMNNFHIDSIWAEEAGIRIKIQATPSGSIVFLKADAMDRDIEVLCTLTDWRAKRLAQDLLGYVEKLGSRTA